MAKDETNKEGLENIRFLLNHTIYEISKQIIGCSILLDISTSNPLPFKQHINKKVKKILDDFCGNKLKCICTKKK